MEDDRCCGTGTCIINEDGRCWCGQRWDGTRMCFPEAVGTQGGGDATPAQPSAQSATGDSDAH